MGNLSEAGEKGGCARVAESVRTLFSAPVVNMSVSDDEVRWAYRMLLGREPESERVVEEQTTIRDREQLRQIFMNSSEYRSHTSYRLVGRYLEAGPSIVEVDCSPQELERMLSGISREWTGFGERDPHWSVLVNDKFLMPNVRAHEDEFYATGIPDVAQLLAMIGRNRPSAQLARALDFGCGVGRLSLALAPHVGHVLGLDISAPHLVWARERSSKAGISNVTFDTISTVNDISRYNGQDLIISMIVLQHNPPPVMATILLQLLGLLTPGGLAIFQVPTFLEGYSFSVADYLAAEQPSMEMNALPQSVIFELIYRAGCRPVEVREDGRIGATPGLSHTFLVERTA
nr:class I SAM-dependent methyltransferase [Sphingomonas quercus]